MSKQEPPFHNPFAAAKSKLSAVVVKPNHPPAPAAKTATKSARLPLPLAPSGEKGRGEGSSAPPATAANRPASDERLFSDEMFGVARLDPDPRGRVRAPEATHTTPLPPRRIADDAEAYALLADLIEGSGHFDFADGDEFVEGIAPGLDRRILKRLRKGEYALQCHVDLHGMTRDEARATVERFVAESRSHGHRCILIIHGRGLNSKDQLPILKERVRAWLERGRIAKAVLAFCSARPCDGGAGAVYVLLRR
ncbi:MAG: DNA mismatch repair protein MutS [Myxococcales bacterium]|nr:DNA mismatch repair protein MutS [Myxococcales bacterium]